jgi:hypothetical protein
MSKGFTTSFSERKEQGKSFFDRYPFIKKYADDMNVSILTMEDLIPFYASTEEFAKFALHVLSTVPQTTSVTILQEQIQTLGFLGEATKLLGYAGTACVKARKSTLGVDDKNIISEFISYVEDDSKWYKKDPFNAASVKSIKDWSQVCEHYSRVWQHPDEFGISKPSSARDYLKNKMFNDIMRQYLLGRFVTMCAPRGGGMLAKLGEGVGDDYISSIIENGLSDVNQDNRTDIVIVIVSNVAPYPVQSFIAAEKGINDDVHGQLVCSAPDAPQGLAKLLFSTTLLAAKDAGVNFIFLQAVSGLFGVQASLYSRFGFEFNFSPALLKRETALDQYIGASESLELLGSRMRTKGRYHGTVGELPNRLAVWHQRYATNKSWINWAASSLTRIGISVTLTPMWLYAPLVSSACIQNMLSKKGWDCREGSAGGAGGLGNKGDTRSWYGMIQRIAGLEPSHEKVASKYFDPNNKENPISTVEYSQSSSSSSSSSKPVLLAGKMDTEKRHDGSFCVYNDDCLSDLCHNSTCTSTR